MQRFSDRVGRSCLMLGIVAVAAFFSGAGIQAQTIVDKTVATVSDGTRIELITYSDLLWQLALRPGIDLTPPSSENLNIALQLIINQRLLALEAQRVPQDPTEDEVNAEVERVLALFPSTADFEKRLRLVGFKSVRDENFQEIMEQRVAIEKYIDFRFEAFAVITPEDEETYYNDIFIRNFRRRNPGLVVPSLEEVRTQIRETLIQQKVARDIEKFLDEAKTRAEIVLLNDV